MDIEFSSDPKIQELQLLQLIYPQINIDFDLISGSIDISIDKPEGVEIDVNGGTFTVHHLPPILLSFSLPKGYPYDIPMEFSLRCEYIPNLQQVHQELSELWDHDQALFTIIDELNHRSSTIGNFSCKVSEIDTYLDFDKNKKQEIFNKHTFGCEVCQTDAKGIRCSQFACGHVFCNDCLKGFFTSLILSGSVDKVHCPNFECTAAFTKQRRNNLDLDSLNELFDFDQFSRSLLTQPVSLDILRNIFKGEEDAEILISRYVDLFLKQQHETIASLFPARLVSCPHCPEMIFRENLNDALVVCQKCRYAFCYDCRKSWHGKYLKCKGSQKGRYGDIPEDMLQKWLDSEDDTATRTQLGFTYGKALIRRMANEFLMDQLFDQLIADDTQGLKKCPTCGIVIQRSDGCNKMRCISCQTIFCNLCGDYLDPGDPYEHYRDRISFCYGRLFEGMPGTET